MTFPARKCVRQVNSCAMAFFGLTLSVSSMQHSLSSFLEFECARKIYLLIWLNLPHRSYANDQAVTALQLQLLWLRAMIHAGEFVQFKTYILIAAFRPPRGLRGRTFHALMHIIYSLLHMLYRAMNTMNTMLICYAMWSSLSKCILSYGGRNPGSPWFTPSLS
jgi:hypothetical protein